MKPADLQLVREASQRERAHHALNVKFGLPASACYCGRCRADRETIAAAAPWLLAYVSEAQNVSRRVHFDLGELD